ncbi:MAG: polymerase subunit gamma and tau, partial [Tardiphaga sp.]|nr:polymerase subunit gamma and tau [Tardiphaga sp.]
GDIASAFAEFRDQYDTGADPIVVLSDLAEFVNIVTRVKVVPATADNVAFGETERLRAREFASSLSMRVLSRMWQMLLKGITEVQGATRPAAAAEMVLVRIAYVADLPTPDEALRMLDQSGGGTTPMIGSGGPSVSRGTPGVSATSSSSMPAIGSSAPRAALSRGQAETMAKPQPATQQAPAAPVLRITTFPELVALATEKRDVLTRAALEADVRLVKIEDGRLEVAMERSAARTLINDLSRKLEQWTGRRWSVIVSNEQGEPTLRSQAEAAKNRRYSEAEADPRVREVLAKFPGAKVVEVRKIELDQQDDAAGGDIPDNPDDDSDD